MKLLSPAGNMESLITAVYNGADEVYLGINDFNARNNIDGFTLETLEQAVDFAHIYNVKVYLAINILFTNEELNDAVSTVVKAYNLGVDAFIIQDLGLIKILSKDYPKIELHASTQMGIHNLEGVKYLEQFGVKRVVLSRETPLAEIKRIRKNSNVEIEYFVQGALCVCFSGNCYLSSRLFNESGNRGKCKQPCRLPYKLKHNGKVIKNGYLLSAKDFNMINRLKDLQDAGVDSLKIEGRARRPFYVGAVTREYKNALLGLKVNPENIKLAFNRNYTEGYFNSNGEIISSIQSHIGVSLGKVSKVINGKKFNQVYIETKK
ncbi:MAG: U32 family peptidase, partial [Clostridia bacterium]|nr:U32 family peptidase [Clostridia bacterium]